jgi:hypothetical protein
MMWLVAGFLLITLALVVAVAMQPTTARPPLPTMARERVGFTVESISTETTPEFVLRTEVGTRNLHGVCVRYTIRGQSDLEEGSDEAAVASADWQPSTTVPSWSYTFLDDDGVLEGHLAEELMPTSKIRSHTLSPSGVTSGTTGYTVTTCFQSFALPPEATGIELKLNETPAETVEDWETNQSLWQDSTEYVEAAMCPWVNGCED